MSDDQKQNHQNQKPEQDAPAGTIDEDSKDAQVAAAGATAADAESASEDPQATDG